MRIVRWFLLLCMGPMALSQNTPFEGQSVPLPGERESSKCLGRAAASGQHRFGSSAVLGLPAPAYFPWVEQITGLPTDHVVLSMHAVDANTVWAIGARNGASQSYTRTTDGGVTWRADTVHIAPSSYCCGSICALDADRAWIAMHSHITSSGGGMFMTTNGGATWRRYKDVFESTNGWPNFIHFFDDNNGICVGDPTDGYFEIYITSNGGTSWSRLPESSIPSPLAGEVAVAGEFTAVGSSLWFPVYTTRKDGGRRFYKTSDEGKSWSVLEFPTEGERDWLPTLEFQDEQVGLGQNSSDGILKTTDGGLSWTLLPNTSWLVLNHQEYVPQTSGMYVATVTDVSCSPRICCTVFTIDGGVTWTRTGEFSGRPDLCFVSPQSGWRGMEDSPNIYKWTIPSGRVISGCPTALAYGMTEVGKSGSTLDVHITNYGKEPLSVSEVSLSSSNFTVTEEPELHVKVASLHSLKFSVTFTPKDKGVLVDSIGFLSNASNAPNMFVRLQGAGVKIQAAAPRRLYAAGTSLFALNMPGGSPALIGPLGSTALHGLTIQPRTDELYGSSSTSSATAVYRICCVTGFKSLVKSFPIGYMRAIAFNGNGDLYGASRYGRLYQLNLLTGDTIGIGTAPDVVYGSLAFSPNGELWASVIPSTSGKDRIYTVNTTTGEATLVGSTGDNDYTPSIFFDSHDALYGLKGTGIQTNTVISIDMGTGAGTPLFSTGMSGITAMTMKSLRTDVEPGETMPDILRTGAKLSESVQSGCDDQVSGGKNEPRPTLPSTTSSAGRWQYLSTAGKSRGATK